MNLKKILCALLCALMCVSGLALGEEDAQAPLPAIAEPEQTDESAAGADPEQTGEPAVGDKDARIAELEALVAQLQAQVDAYHLKEIVAAFDGGEVSLADAQAVYAQYESMYAQYGIDLAAYGMEDTVKQQVINELAEAAIVHHMAGQLGLGLTEETRAAFEAEATASYEDTIRMYYESYYQEQYPDEAEGMAAVATELNAMGYSYESVLENLVNSYLSEQVYNYVTKDVVVTDEDVQAAYDALVAEDEANYAQSAYQFETAHSSGTQIYYTPEGFRNVKHILFQFSDEQSETYASLSARLQELEAEQAAAANAGADEQSAAEGEDGAPEETVPPEPARAAEEISADIEAVNQQLDALYLELMPEVEAAITRFENGEDIEALIAELSDDAGMPAGGYAVSTTAEASSQAWDTAFTEGANAIAAPGELSEPVRGIYGIHLIYYVGDLTAGATPFDEVRDVVEDSATQDKLNQTYLSQLDAWKLDLNLQTYLENM